MKTLLALSAVLVMIATAAPTALGARFMSDTLGGNGHSAQTQSHGFITDTLGGNGHPQQAQGFVFMTDTLAPGGGLLVQAPSAGPGFDWADAGIGAATSIGALLVLIGGSLVTLRRRGRFAV